MEYCGQFNLKNHSTLRVGPLSAHAVYIDSKEDIEKALELAVKLNLTPYPLGGGSNTIFDDSAQNKFLFLIPRMRKMEIALEKNNRTLFYIEAGVLWDEAVAEAVELELSGLEALSSIPGLTGSAPVQNIGAYGAEVKDTIETVHAYDMQKKAFADFTKQACEFEYRNSTFKKNPGRYFIYAVTFSLSKARPSVPEYRDIISYFETKKIQEPSLKEIREAIIEIRNNKLPNPKETPNAGSYFKNPIISQAEADALKVKFPDMPIYPAREGFVKLFAGWLIDKAGLKNTMYGNFGIHKNHALVMIGNGQGTFSELLESEKNITQKVCDIFGVYLEREPVIVN